MATKMYAPKQRDLVARPRLHQRLRTAAAVRLVLVSAPAGFGKTTLLADWVAEHTDGGAGGAWVSLDPSDSNPVLFWSCVASSLDGAVPGIESSVRELLDISPLPLELMITTMVNELAGSSQDVWLVLDDYHVVDCREIDQGMAVLLDRLPSHVHVAIGTRVDPALPLPRWRVRGELIEIRAADLRFTADEAAMYLNDVAELGLADDEVEILDERTEGWVAALQLAALSMRGHTDVRGFIERFAGNNRYIVDYLVEEVLERQPDHVRQFLWQSSVLDRLTGSLCDSVTGGRDGRAMLEMLERANLFVVSLDDRREWYRYHHLFADVLRARALGDQPERVGLNHQRASEWYERHDLTDDAIRHALAAADFGRASRLIEQAVLTLVRAGVLPGAVMPMSRRYRHDAILIDWLPALPAEVVRPSPVLSVCYGWMLTATGRFDEVERWFEHAERMIAADSSSPSPQAAEFSWLVAIIEVFRAALAQARGDVPAATDHGRRALELAGPDGHLARAGAAGFIALAAWVKGDVTTALETFAHAVHGLRAAGNLTDELTSSVLLADMCVAAGRPLEARRVLDAALDLAPVRDRPTQRGTADLHVALSEIDLEAGDLEGAKRHLENAASVDRRTAMGENRFRLFVVMSKVAAAEGDLQGAIRHLDQAEQLYQPGSMPDLHPIPAMRARLWINQGRFAEAAEWARAVAVTATDDVDHLREFDHLTLSRLLIARHRAHQHPEGADRALALLGRLHQAAVSSGRRRSAVETDVLSALALEAQGRRFEAVEALERAWADALDPDAHVGLFLDEGAPMLDLLRATASREVGSEWARRVLDVASSVTVASPEIAHEREPSAAPRTLADPLSDREMHVLRLLATDLSGPAIASELFVSLNTFRTHTKRIYTKLDVTSRRAAVSRGRELGLR